MNHMGLKWGKMMFFSRRVFVFSGILIFLFGPFSFSRAADSSPVHILFLGDSLTAGLGVEADQAYPALVEQMLKQHTTVDFKITNAGVSGSTTASARSRLRWFKKIRVDILVLALGANDGLRGLSMNEMKRNLDQTIRLAKDTGMRVILAGMQIPPNYGKAYSDGFKAVFPALAEKYGTALIPFLLEGVAGIPELNQVDGIHPNARGHEIMARTVTPYVLEEMEKRVKDI